MPSRGVQDHAPGVVGRCLSAGVCIAAITAVSGAADASNTPGSSPDREEHEGVGRSEQPRGIPKVPLWGRFEAVVTGAREYANPFTDVELHATFSRPDKSRVSFWGFYDGDGKGSQTGNVWKLRFLPDQVGMWSYECSFSDGTPGKTGTFECVSDGAMPGPLRVDPVNPRCWIFADGSRFFPLAYTAPELFVAGNHADRTYWIDYFFGPRHKFNLCNANLLNFVGVGEELNWQGAPYTAPDPARDGRYVTIGGNGLFPFLYSGMHPRFDGGSNVDWLRPGVRCWVNAESLCLADLGREYVVCRQSGGTITIDLPAAGPAFTAEWLDPRTGDRKAAAAVEGGAKRAFSCPDLQDGVLHLDRGDDSAK